MYPLPIQFRWRHLQLYFRHSGEKTENKRDMISHRSINMVNPFTNGGLFTSTLRVLGENNG